MGLFARIVSSEENHPPPLLTAPGEPRRFWNNVGIKNGGGSRYRFAWMDPDVVEFTEIHQFPHGFASDHPLLSRLRMLRDALIMAREPIS